jgi:hypothetical protein
MSALSSVPPYPLSTPSLGVAAPADSVAPAEHAAAVPPVTPAPSGGAAAEDKDPGGFSIRFDADMHRLVLQLRDPRTGLVTFQNPPKQVARQIEATANAIAAEPRGQTLDGSA